MALATFVIRILLCMGILWPGSPALSEQDPIPFDSSLLQDGGGDEPEDKPEDEKKKEKEKEKGDEEKGDDDKEDDEEDSEGEDEVELEDEDADEDEDEDEDEEEVDEEEQEAAVLVTIEFLTSIEWRRGREVPAEVMAFDGKRVKIAGYMATGTPVGSETFELVPQSCECGRSKLHHFVRVSIEDGGASFDPGRRQFEGTLSIGEQEDEDGFVTSLYRLNVDTFDPQDPEDEGRGPNQN